MTAKHATNVWYVCQECGKSVLWIHRVAHRLLCGGCKDGKSKLCVQTSMSLGG